MKQDKLIKLFLNELPNPELEQKILFEQNAELAGESYCISKSEEDFLIQAGDEKGFAYGVQTLAEWLRGNEDAEFPEQGICGSPEVKVRGVDRFIMNTDDEEWWLTEEYWEQYIQMLALSRINRLCFATGFDTEYLSPPYPFLCRDGKRALTRQHR